MKFTAPQTKAIKHTKGNLQLVACAGSGKTEVVARRVVNLLGSGVEPAGIVAFTYTNKAAGELKERITARCHEAGIVYGLLKCMWGACTLLPGITPARGPQVSKVRSLERDPATVVYQPVQHQERVNEVDGPQWRCLEEICEQWPLLSGSKYFARVSDRCQGSGKLFSGQRAKRLQRTIGGKKLF
jgi:UvrD/REP helicase N-terminal domain